MPRISAFAHDYFVDRAIDTSTVVEQMYRLHSFEFSLSAARFYLAGPLLVR